MQLVTEYRMGQKFRRRWRLPTFAMMGVLLATPLTSQLCIAKTLSGKITFDRVPDTPDTGLDYSHITQQPIRNAKVELLDADGRAMKHVVSEQDGSYSFDLGKSKDSVRIRVVAETDSPKVTVKDNTNQNALYSIVSDLIDTSAGDMTFNLNASSGWDGTQYSSTRAAAPFACLDTIYTAAQSFVAVRPKADFPELTVFWSVNNRPESGDIALGQIDTSHYSSATTAIYILGSADIDTDEYDAHIMVHEWGHYFENKLGRSDSIGGTHGSGDIIDPRVAFGEGWGNALSGIILYPDSVYKDTSGVGQSQSFSFNVEDNLPDSDTHPGWFSEVSVQSTLYDLFDPTTSEPYDQVALGLGPIYDVMTGGQKNTDALTTIFSFVTALKQYLKDNKANSNVAAAVDILVKYEKIQPVQDEFGTGETNDGGSSSNLPVYHTMTVSGPDETLTFQASVDNINKLGANRYVRFSADKNDDLVITVNSQQDVALTLYENGKTVAFADDTTSGDETIEFKGKKKKTYILVVQGQKTGGSGTYNATVHIN